MVSYRCSFCASSFSARRSLEVVLVQRLEGEAHDRLNRSMTTSSD